MTLSVTKKNNPQNQQPGTDSLQMPLTSSESLQNLRSAVERGVTGEEIVDMGKALRIARAQEQQEMYAAQKKAKEDRLNALTHKMHLARAMHSGSGTDYQISLRGARIAEQQGNTSPILQATLDKYDGQRVKLPPSSVYITPIDERAYQRTQAEKGHVNAINRFDSFLEESFMQTFRADPASTKRISRAGGSRTESEEKIRGGILLLAEKYKQAGNQAGLASLKERIKEDPKLLATLKTSELRSTFDMTSNHLPSRTQNLDLDVFARSFNKLRNNHPELSNEDFLKLAVHNLKAKNYKNTDLLALSNIADDRKHGELAKVLLASTDAHHSRKLSV